MWGTPGWDTQSRPSEWGLGENCRLPRELGLVILVHVLLKEAPRSTLDWEDLKACLTGKE